MTSRTYFAAIPNMDDEDLDLFQYRLMGHYRHEYGFYRKPCDESTRVTAKKLGMSIGKVSQARAQLATMGRIIVTYKGKGLEVIPVDIWEANHQRGVNRSSGEHVHEVNDDEPKDGSPGETVHQMNDEDKTVHFMNGSHEHVHGVNDASEERQESLKIQELKDQEKESLESLKEIARVSPSEAQLEVWQITYNQLELQLDRASFATWLKGATLLAIETPLDPPAPPIWVIGVRTAYARDMCEHRLGRNITRLFHDCGGVWLPEAKTAELKYELQPSLSKGAT